MCVYIKITRSIYLFVSYNYNFYVSVYEYRVWCIHNSSQQNFNRIPSYAFMGLLPPQTSEAKTEAILQPGTLVHDKVKTVVAVSDISKHSANTEFSAF